jgi:hypothetical protein
MDPTAALDAVADTDLDDATVTVVTCVCPERHCICEERYAVALTPAQCVGVVWAWRSGLAMAEA